VDEKHFADSRQEPRPYLKAAADSRPGHRGQDGCSLRLRGVEQQDAADEVRAFTMAALAADLGVSRTGTEMTGTRHLPVPITMPQGAVGRGHLFPELSALSSPAQGFVTLPGGKSVAYGMIAFLGTTITLDQMLERWESEMGVVADREAALATLSLYIGGLASLKVGNVIQARYDESRFVALVKIRDTPPPSSEAQLPE
jgi:hypothetical protein